MFRVDRDYSERNGDGPIAALHSRLYDMAVEEIQARPLPDRDLGSLQSVRAFRRVTMADSVHPEMIPLLHPDDLSEIVDEARDVAVRADSTHFSYIEDSQYEGLVGLQTEAQEAALAQYNAKIAAREKKKLARAKAAGHKVDVNVAPELSPGEIAAAKRESDKWKDYRRTQAQLKIDRWKNGFHQHTTKEVAGYHYPAFSEYFGKGILRGHIDPALSRFVQLLPKAGRLRVGMDKAVLMSTTSKVLALDAPYVELDPKRLGMVVVELDTVWKTPGALREALLTILGPRMMPQIIVGRRDANGRLLRPHLIWLLNPKFIDADGVERDGTVWNDPVRTIIDENGNERVVGDKRCQMKPIRKFFAVQRSMVALLAPIGADPACHNVNRPKNPVSVYMTAICPNNDYWPILDDFETIPGYCRKVNEEALEEIAAKMRLEATGVEPSTSNLAWKTVGAVIIPMARLALKTRTPDFVHAGRSVETLTAWFDAQVRPLVEGDLGPSPTLDRVLARRCRFAANWCRTAKVGRGVYRGRDRDSILMTIPDGEGGERNLTPAERATLTAERTNEHRHALPMWNMCKELIGAVSVTGSIDKAEFLKGICLVSKAFGYKHWDEAVRKCGLIERDGRFHDAAPKIKRADYTSKTIDTSLPSEPQPAIVSTFHGQPIIGFQFDSSDPAPDHHRSPVIRSNISGPPDPAWPTHVQSSAESCQTVTLHALESA
ncbi:MAG: hypothetical protein JWQ83_1154 [Lacunisphaera sp.]|nr:hypothetical protein [Lacunisphaera sp.]